MVIQELVGLGLTSSRNVPDYSQGWNHQIHLLRVANLDHPRDEILDLHQVTDL